MGIPNIFSAMCSLHLTRPQDAFRPPSSLKWGDDGDANEEVFRTDFEEEHQLAHAMSLIPLRCLSPQWQHDKLRDLTIEGEGLGVLIPALPCLKSLLISCAGDVAIDFIDPVHLGHTITRLNISGRRIWIDVQQQHELCKALMVRNLELGGDWSQCVMLHASGHPVATMVNEYKCMCKACPQCLGIEAESKHCCW